MQRGPHPILVHMGASIASDESIRKYVLATNESNKNYESDFLETAIKGIQLYQSHPYKRPVLENNSLWRHENTKLIEPVFSAQKLQKHKKVKPDSFPILIIPSLINKSTILDIDEDRSLLRWLHSQGRDAYLLDWGDLIDNEDQDITITDIIEQKVLNAVRFVSNKKNTPVDIIGYCMGGTLSIGAASIQDAQIGRIILLASPWNFFDPSNDLAKNVRIWFPHVKNLIEQKNALPAEWINALFASYDKGGTLKKFAKFAQMDQSGADAKRFIAVEDWLNDGVDLPFNIANHCMQEWFFENAPYENKWNLEHRHLDMRNIKNNMLIIASNRDRLVPFNSTVSVQKTLKNAKIDVLQQSCGHIGLIVGENAQKTVWNPMVQWLRKTDENPF